MEYATFEGSIPKGEYGGGKVNVWDSGTYETEKFRDNAPDGPEKGGEVIVTLHGSKVYGPYALIQTDGKNWLAHRMKEQAQPHRSGPGADAGHRRLGAEAEVGACGRSRASGTDTGCWSMPTTARLNCGRAVGAT